MCKVSLWSYVLLCTKGDAPGPFQIGSAIEVGGTSKSDVLIRMIAVIMSTVPVSSDWSSAFRIGLCPKTSTLVICVFWCLKGSDSNARQSYSSLRLVHVVRLSRWLLILIYRSSSNAFRTQLAVLHVMHMLHISRAITDGLSPRSSVARSDPSRFQERPFWWCVFLSCLHAVSLERSVFRASVEHQASEKILISRALVSCVSAFWSRV